MSAAMTDEELKEAAARLDASSLADTLGWVERRFGDRAALASSWSAEDVVVIHAAQAHAPSLRVFTLDTGRLPAETYELIDVLRRRFGLAVETFAPRTEAVEELVRARGFHSFRESLERRHECCEIRKVEPLRRALSTRQAWLTGLRREQSPTRADVPVVERDLANGGIAKVNPLAGWTEAQVWSYVREHALPYSALYDRGYRSIGCAPCTRALRPWEDARAGRWWWEQPDQKECGLHVQR